MAQLQVFANVHTARAVAPRAEAAVERSISRAHRFCPVVYRKMRAEPPPEKKKKKGGRREETHPDPDCQLQTFEMMNESCLVHARNGNLAKWSNICHDCHPS